MVAYLSDSAGDYDPQQSKTGLDVTVRQIEGKPTNMYAAQMDYLSNCIETSTKPAINTGEEGLRILKIVKAAYKSNATGCKEIIE